MSDNGELPEKTPMDQKVDQATKTKFPPFEKLEAKGEGGKLIADSHQPLDRTEAAKLTSWSMVEIERALSKSTLRSPRDSIDTFGRAVNQKSDMRMRSLAQQLQTNLTREHAKEISSGPTSNRVRGFDIQSQTMRMVAANASLGSYQFQKSQVLPYMRKNLALGYQKVSLLKTIAKGIGSLEKALVSKLEAIKLNTAASAPRKQSFFQKLWADVGFLNRRRIAGNISDFTMDGWSDKYKKYVVPGARKISNVLGDTSVKGGINGLRRAATGKLNSARRTTREMIQNADTTTRGGRIKRLAALGAERILGSSVRTAQRMRLGEDTNAKVAGVVKPLSDLPGRFNPFSGAGYGDTGSYGFGKREEPQTLLGQFKDWRKEYTEKTETIIDHLAAIRGGKKGMGKGKGGGGSSGPTPTGLPATETEGSGYRPLFAGLREKFRPGGTPLLSPLRADTGTDATAIGDAILRSRAILDERQKRKEARRQKFADFKAKIKQELHDAYNPEDKPVVAAPKPSTHKVEPRWPRNRPQAPAAAKAPVDRAFFTGLFERLGKRVERVSETVDDGNQKRSLFEKLQEKWKQTAERSSQQKTRKNSYEDLQNQREKKRSLLGRIGDRAKGLVQGVGANLAQGNLLGAGSSAIDSAVDWAKDTASEWAGEQLEDRLGGAADKVRTKGGKALRRGKLAARRLGRRGRGLFSRGAGALAEEAAESAIGHSTSARTAAATRNALNTTGRLTAKAAGGTVRLGGKALAGAAKGTVRAIPVVAKAGLRATKTAVPMAFKAAKTTAKVAGGVGWGITKGVAGAGLDLGKAALGSKLVGGLVKGGVLAAGVGYGGDIAKEWLDKNTTGATNRLGKTAATAAQWGATGAMFGPWGAALGAAAGAIYENSDILAKGLKAAGGIVMSGFRAVGRGIAAVGKGIWHGMFGKSAVIGKDGKVKEKEQQSVFGGIKSMLFGRDTKYTKDGQVLRTGREGLFPAVGSSLKTAFFGQEAKYDKTGKLIAKETPSLLESLKGTFFGTDAKYDKNGKLISAGKKSFISRTLSSVSKNLFGVDTDDKKSMFSSLKDKFSSVGSDLSKGVNSLIEGLKNGASGVGSAISGAAGAVGGAVADAGQWAMGAGKSMVQGLQGMLTKILEYEGGDKVISDTGGLTKYGISQKGNPGVNIRALTEQDARNIYAQKYAAPLGLDKYPPAVGFVALDAAVNQGPGYAKKLLAQGGNDPLRMIQMRRQFYQDLVNRNPGKYGQYLKGWNNRMDRLAKDIGAVKTPTGAPANTTPQMASTTPGTKAQPKAAVNPGSALMASGTPMKYGAFTKPGTPSSTVTPQMAAMMGAPAPKSNAAPATSGKPALAASPAPKTPAVTKPALAAATAAVAKTPVATKPVAKVATASPASASTTGTVKTPVKTQVAKTEPTVSPPKPARAAKVPETAMADANLLSAKHIGDLIASIVDQTKAISANTAALGQHGTAMDGYQKTAMQVAETNSKTAATIIPIVAKGSQPPPPPASGASSIGGVVMSMAKTSVRTGNYT